MIAGMAAATTPVVVMRAESGGLLVGHVAVGSSVAGLVQRREGDPQQSYTATVLGGAGGAVHGGNAAGLVCAALDAGAVAQGLVVRVLTRAVSAEQAARLVAEEQSVAGTVALLVADARQAVCITVDGAGANVRDVETDGAVSLAAGAVGAVTELVAAMRTLEPLPDIHQAPVAGMAALLVPGEPPRLHLALGPPSCAVFIRHWPGMELGPDESATPEGAPLARLAVAVAQATSNDPELRSLARARLDRAEAEALREGEAAESMAARMDGDTDDRGAAVRRLVAQSYAAELARRALEELAVPATRPGGSPRL